MYGQFFGSFLLNKKAVTPQELNDAITTMGKSHIRLGTLAMYKGYMTSDEVDEVCFIQRREDKHFGEIALDRSYLFEDQLQDLLNSQIPDYLRLGQTLVDSEVLSNSALHDLLVEYNSENDHEIQSDSDAMDLIPADPNTAEIRNFLKAFNYEISDQAITYIQLLLNNLIRFLGNDFTPLEPVSPDEYHTNYCVRQHMSGAIDLDARLDMEKDTAVAFASRYAEMEFEEFDEYVSASLEDFLNLHNGLFAVNMSNEYSYEVELDPPEHEEDVLIELPKPSIAIPIIYPFGTIYLILSKND